MKKEIIEINRKAQKEKDKIIFNIAKLNAFAQFKELVIEVEEKNTKIIAKYENSNNKELDESCENENYDESEDEEFYYDEPEDEEDYTEQEREVLDKIKEQPKEYLLRTIFDYITTIEDEDNKEKAYNCLIHLLTEKYDLSKMLTEIERLLYIVVNSKSYLIYEEKVTQKVFLTDTVLNILEQWDIDYYLADYNISPYNSNADIDKIALVLGYNNINIPAELLDEVFSSIIEKEQDKKIKLGYQLSYASKLVKEKIENKNFKIKPEQMENIVKMFVLSICMERFYATSEVSGCFSEKISSKNHQNGNIINDLEVIDCFLNNIENENFDFYSIIDKVNEEENSSETAEFFKAIKDDNNDYIQELIKNKLFEKFIKEQEKRVLINDRELETDTYMALLINSCTIQDGEFQEEVLEINEILNNDKLTSEDIFKIISVLFYIENSFSEGFMGKDKKTINNVCNAIRGAIYSKNNNKEYTRMSIEGKTSLLEFLNKFITIENSNEIEEDTER